VDIKDRRRRKTEFRENFGADMTGFCRSCDICQKTIAKGRVPSVPLGKMPIIDDITDDIILISPSVLMLQHLLHACEIELNNIDMAINFKKSSCLRVGPRYDATCACITSLDGSII